MRSSRFVIAPLEGSKRRAADPVDDPLDLEVEIGEDEVDRVQEPIDVVASRGRCRATHTEDGLLRPIDTSVCAAICGPGGRSGHVRRRLGALLVGAGVWPAPDAAPQRRSPD